MKTTTKELRCGCNRLLMEVFREKEVKRCKPVEKNLKIKCPKCGVFNYYKIEGK